MFAKLQKLGQTRTVMLEGLRILIVEDDKLFQTVFKSILESLKCEGHTVSDAKSALAALADLAVTIHRLVK